MSQIQPCPKSDFQHTRNSSIASFLHHIWQLCELSVNFEFLQTTRFKYPRAGADHLFTNIVIYDDAGVFWPASSYIIMVWHWVEVPSISLVMMASEVSAYMQDTVCKWQCQKTPLN